MHHAYAARWVTASHECRAKLLREACFLPVGAVLGRTRQMKESLEL
jgi:hypothetical protein